MAFFLLKYIRNSFDAAQNLRMPVWQKRNGKFEHGLECPAVHFSHWMHNNLSFLMVYAYLRRTDENRSVTYCDRSQNSGDMHRYICYDDTSDGGERSMLSY